MNYENLTEFEIDRVIAQVPLKVREQLQRENLVLAGGLIRDTVAGIPVKDVDIFCHSQAQAERLALELYPFIKHTTFAYTVPAPAFELDIQYVFYKDFTDAKDLVSQFDFRACCAGIWWQPTEERGSYYTNPRWVSVAVEGFVFDCKQKALVFMSQRKDAGKLTALGRALKFAPRGWTLSPDEATNILVHFEPTFQRDRVRRSFAPHYGRQ